MNSQDSMQNLPGPSDSMSQTSRSSDSRRSDKALGLGREKKTSAKTGTLGKNPENGNLPQNYKFRDNKENRIQQILQQEQQQQLQQQQKTTQSNTNTSSQMSRQTQNRVQIVRPKSAGMAGMTSKVYSQIDKLTQELVEQQVYTHPFFGLPEAVRVKILKFLGHTERLLAMWVCRRFRNEIRYRVGFRTKITEETATSPVSMRDLLVTSVIIGKFDRPISPLSRMIANPDNITELIFEEPICVQHLDAFLNRCRRLKLLVVRTTVVDTSVFPLNTKSPFAGYEWRTLEMIHKFPIAQIYMKEIILTIPGTHSLRTVNRCLALMNTPALERFTLVITHPIAFEETTAVHFAVLNYLKSCLHISHVIICTEQRPSTVRYASRSGNVQSLERELNLFTEKLHLKQLILTEPAVAFETWNIVLNNQNSLEILQICHMTIWPLLKDIVTINAKTLVKVALHVILWDKHGKHNPVDLNVFNRVSNLKELYICVAPPAAEGLVDFVNFTKLPKHLEVLALKNCHVQVKDFLVVRNLTHLKSLGIVSIGNIDGNYIGIKTLRKLVHIRTLEELFISGLMADGKEAEEMKTLINRMKARVKTKNQRFKSTFHCFGQVNRWTTKNGSFTFTIFTNYL